MGADLTTRRGLKKVHADFTRIYDRMNAMYNSNRDKEKITGGIVGIWAKMSTDSILRNKLFEKGKFSVHHVHTCPQAPITTAFILSCFRVGLNGLFGVRLFGEALAAP